jgi:hypothetical protein
MIVGRMTFETPLLLPTMAVPDHLGKAQGVPQRVGNSSIGFSMSSRTAIGSAAKGSLWAGNFNLICWNGEFLTKRLTRAQNCLHL